MKQIYSKMLLLIAMILVGGSAWADEVTFTFKTDKDITYSKTGTSGGSTTNGECIVSKDDVTLVGTNAYTESTKSLSVYAKSTLTVTAPGNITQIDLDYNGKVYMFDEAVGDGKKGEKYGSSGSHKASYVPETPSTSITLNNPNGGKTELLGITIHYVAGSAVKVTGVSLDATSKTLTEGETFTLTATVAPADASNKLVAWSSSNEEVAKVDKNGEVVAIAPGTATITVKTLDGNYTASCAVTVKAAPEPDEYKFLFAPAGSDGDSNASLSTATALNKAFVEGYAYISSITADKVFPARNSLGYGVKFGSSSAAGTITINLKKAVPAKYIIVSAAAYGDAEGQQGFKVNGKSVSMTNALNKAYSDYVIELDGSNLSTVTLTQNEANKGRIYVEYIKVLKDEPMLIKNVVKLSAREKNPDDTYTYYGTFSNEQVTFFPRENVTISTAYVNSDSKLVVENVNETMVEEYLEIEGTMVQKNTGLLISTPTPVVTYYTTEVYSMYDFENNMLRPASEEMTGDYKFYKLAYGDYSAKTDLGFYYGAENGAAFDSKAGTAYLAVPAESAVKSFALNPSATAIQSVNATASASAIYNLAGQRLSQPQKGINIVDGKKVLVK